MSRLLFVNGPAEGHINPTVGVVKELVDRGEQVVYVTTEAFRDLLEQAGATVITYDGKRFMEAFLRGEPNHLLARVIGLLRTADVVIPAVLEHAADVSFDYMIHDSMFGCGYLLAQILRVPAISSCTSFAQSKRAFDGILERISSFMDTEVNERLHQEFQSVADAVSEKYGVTIPSPFEIFCNPAPMSIVYTTREFQPYGDRFDESYTFVGPSITSRGSSAEWSPSELHGKSAIYISLGTITNELPEFYRTCIRALGESEHTVIMSIGRRTKLDDLGPIPDNFMVFDYVVQTEVLQDVRLFVTHGGMNSTSESLYYGVPLIVVPLGKDQPMVAKRVSELGAGVELNPTTLTADELATAVHEVLGNSSYSRISASLSRSFQEAGGAEKAVEAILAYRNQVEARQ